MRRALAVVLSAGAIAAGAVALRAQAGSGDCRSGDPMANVRDPGRLKVLSRCQDASGVVQETRAEPDGDIDVFLRPDPGSVHLVNGGNRHWMNGNLLLEIIPADQPRCRQGQPVRYGRCTGANVATPKVGSHVTAIGPHVYDSGHGHNEIHPVWHLASSGGHGAVAMKSEAEAPENPTTADPDDEENDGPPVVGAPPVPRDYVGSKFRPAGIHEELPSGVEHINQVLLDPGWDPERQPVTPVLERVRTTGGDMLWLERYDVREDGFVTVVDAMLLPARAPGEFFAEPGSCTSGGSLAPTVGAILEWRDTPEASTVRQAWRFDPRTEAIAPLGSTGLSCWLRAHD